MTTSAGITIYLTATTPAFPSTMASRDVTNIVPFSDGPDGKQSKITIDTVVSGTGTMDMEIWDLTNQVTFAYLAPIRVVDNNTGKNLFQGYVQKYKAIVVATYRIWVVHCVDLNAIPDTTAVGVPNGAQWVITDGAQGPVGTNIDPNATSHTPADLFSAYWQYAVAIDTTTYVEPALIPPSVPNPFDRVSLRKAMDDLAALGGPFATWWIDQDAKLHLTNFATVTSIDVLGGTAVTGVVPGGPLTLLMPVGYPDVIPGGGQYVAPYVLTDDDPDFTTTWNYENFSMEVDFSGFRFSLYLRGATDYTGTIITVLPGPPPVYAMNDIQTGGTGWVGTSGDGGPSWLSDFLDAPNANTHATRNAIGQAALRFMQVPLVRGEADVLGAGLAFMAGQLLTITNHVLNLSLAQFFIMRSRITFHSGTDQRRCALQWGTAAKMNMALRAQAQKTATPPPPKGATINSPAAGASSVSAGASVVVGTQLMNSQGQPWAIAGKTVNWSCQVVDDTGLDVTGTTTFTLNPTSSTTDASGKASTTLTTDATKTGVNYLVTATTPS